MLAALSNRINTLLLVLLALMAAAILAILATRASGGPLDPPGPPASSMQTLNDIPGAWGRLLNSTNGDPSGCGSDRFECAYFTGDCTSICHFSDAAVLDHETGLVWTRNMTVAGSPATWLAASGMCTGLKVANRLGWRLPSAAELSSLLDQSVLAPAVSLPAGHPFTNPPTTGDAADWFWTSTLYTNASPTSYSTVSFLGSFSGAPGFTGAEVTTNVARVWCVRGAATQ